MQPTDAVSRLFYVMIKTFKITAFGSREFEDCWEKETQPNNVNSDPLQNILAALKILSCRTVLFEYDYVDADYLDEFASFYCRAFKKYPSRCTRVHFFSVDIPSDARLEMGKHAGEGSYLGFMVLRPTDLQRVGRTVIASTADSDKDEFITCKTCFDAHLLGESFTVEGTPFIQQDTQVGACAQASVWMLARYMSRRFGYRKQFPGYINTVAKSKLSLGRPLPAENGLTAVQMMDALEEMGFPCMSYQIEDMGAYSEHLNSIFPDPRKQCKAKMADIAYRYIESGLPVIMLTKNHAMLAIGHTYNYGVSANVAIERIPAFFVNNDNQGPYRLMPIWTLSAEYDFNQVDFLIATTPVEVTLSGEMAEEMARANLDAVLNTAMDKTPASPIYKDVLAIVNPDLILLLKKGEFRTYLMPSVDFQRQIRSERDEGLLPADLCNRLIEMDYPKYVWITEISSSTLLNSPVGSERKCLGRIIVDSTAPARTVGLMTLHLGNLLFRYDRQSASLKPSDFGIIAGCEPFRHKVWGDDHP